MVAAVLWVAFTKTKQKLESSGKRKRERRCGKRSKVKVRRVSLFSISSIVVVPDDEHVDVRNIRWNSS